MISLSLLLVAFAPAPAAEASGSVEVGAKPPVAEAGADSTTTPPPGPPKRLSKRKHLKWIDRWAPERNTAELGVYGGLIIPARDLELFEADRTLPEQGFRPLGNVAGEFGGRVGYYPMRFLGLEVEGGAMPTNADGERATMWTVRGHVVGQLGLWSVTPFAVIGAGALGVASPRAAVGNDVDASLHLGLGVKAYLSRRAMLRLDLRDVITARRGVSEGATNTIEVLLGVSIVLGRKKDRDDPQTTPPPPADRDGDGVLDRDDRCIDVPGVKPSGCPPELDTDGDGFLDTKDACPDVPGIAPDGCPNPDADNDGILVPDDQCPEQAETRNGFEDTDGCPDEVPKEFGALEVLEGVFFDINKDTLKPESKKTLDDAVAALQKHGSVRVEISGHSDSTGNRDHNMQLSQRRADAVKQYLVDHGIESARMETRGAGPDEPLDSNATSKGRAQNRRIEFRVLR
ncbi:MAG: OmpA family protein [Deltaproteobacteria bacterium]|nr:OmpA family protein [Nannocystaceae bacterium]